MVVESEELFPRKFYATLKRKQLKNTVQMCIRDRSGTKRSISIKRNNVMVPNVTSGSSFYRVIAYNKIKVDDVTAKVLCCLLYTSPIVPGRSNSTTS